MTALPTPPEIVLPAIHLNGTGRDNLLAEYAATRVALLEARDALAGVTVHPRDYYPISEQAFYQARDVHRYHLEALRQSIEYIDAHLANLRS